MSFRYVVGSFMHLSQVSDRDKELFQSHYRYAMVISYNTNITSLTTAL